MKLQEIAKKFDVSRLKRSKTRISEERWEEIDSGAQLTISELQEVARLLGIELRNFVREPIHKTSVNLMFRQRAADDPDYQQSVNQITNRIDLISSTIQHSGVFGGHNPLFEIPIPEDSYEAADKSAHILREIFFSGSLGPLNDLPQVLCERADVLLFTLSSQKIEGAAAVQDGVPFIFLSHRRFLPRMLFSLAHELGHLIAHLRDGKEGSAIIDGPGNIGNFGKGTNIDKRKSEYFADAFASCLLMPHEGVGVFLQELRGQVSADKDQLSDVEILLLSYYFNVSFQVAARRCEDLRLLPAGGGNALYSAIKKRFDNPEQMAAALELGQRSTVNFENVNHKLRRHLISQVVSGNLSKGRAQELLDDVIANDPSS